MEQLISHISNALQGIYDEPERKEIAEQVVEHLTGMGHIQQWLNRRTPVVLSSEKEAQLQSILRRLQQGEPLQYVLGYIDYMGLRLQVDSRALIPRPETAELIEKIASIKEPNIRLTDIGTGSGVIAIALKKVHPDWEVTALDVSTDALTLAQSNALANETNIHFVQCDILNQDIAPCDIIVSNPPYVCQSEQKDMSLHVLDHEPHTALFVADTNPLLFYRRIAELHRAPRLYFEINQRFDDSIEELLRHEGYNQVDTWKDMYGNYRFAFASCL